MPLYEYECDACGRRFEIIQKFSDPPPETCRLCGKGPARRLMSSPAIQFKGTGFYITDYTQKEKGRSDDSSSKTPENKGSDAAKSETTKSDSGGSGTETSTKSDTKSDTAGSSTSSASTSGTSKESSSGTPKE